MSQLTSLLIDSSEFPESKNAFLPDHTMIKLLLLSCLCHPAFAQTWNCTNVLDWNFFGAQLTENNLGGLGPNLQDNQELRYSGVIAKGSLHGDLVVKADKRYQVHNATKNGLSGEFGQINIQGSSMALFTFALVQAGTDTPFPIDATEKLQFSVYDFDAGNSAEHEFAQFMSEVASHSVTAKTTVAVSGNDGDGTLLARSTRLGSEDDNPTDPLNMSELAENSKISVTYVGKSSWEIVFGDEGGQTKRGRNLLFAGRSQGDCACIGVSDWTIHENLQHNNLGGMGPVATDPPELRYSNVFKTGRDQQAIDLVVKVANGSAYRPANTTLNGLWPPLPDGHPDHTQMAQINVGVGTETIFDFTFVVSGTDTEYSLSNVLFSVYDLDQKAGFVNHEYVVFPRPVTNWTVTEDPPTTVEKTGQNDDGTLRFTSTVVGRLDDNPTDPKKLTPLQQSKSVTVWYSGTSAFKVTFGHDFAKGASAPGGRNILFAGPGIYCPAPSPTAMAPPF